MLGLKMCVRLLKVGYYEKKYAFISEEESME